MTPSGSEPRFADRRDAGRRLVPPLLRLQLSRPVVLALPRGGVPVGYEVARALRAPLDILLVRKIGAPGHEEYGIGAVIGGSHPQQILNEEAMDIVRPPPDYIEAETARQLREIERRRVAYVGDRAPVPTEGRTVIVVDDGVATGGTIRVAVKALRDAGAARIVLAVPVAPKDTVATLTREADDVVCLEAPDDFRAVGLHYVDFDQTTDEEVIALLRDMQGRDESG